MSRYVPVEGHPGLVRDTTSGAILNTNRSAIQAAKEKKRLRLEREKQQKIDKDRLESLESDISEIKEALKLLLQKTHK